MELSSLKISHNYIRKVFLTTNCLRVSMVVVYKVSVSPNNLYLNLIIWLETIKINFLETELMLELNLRLLNLKSLRESVFCSFSIFSIIDMYKKKLQSHPVTPCKCVDLVTCVKAVYY